MSPIVIRELPPNVEDLLLERARSEGRPVGEVAASLLAEAAALADSAADGESADAEGPDEGEMWL